MELGCQGVFRADTAVGGNFGAFTTNRPAHAAAALAAAGLIGHCEERNDKAGILAEAGVTDTAAVNRLLNQEVKAAQAAGLKVLYCIGEKSEEQEAWQQVLGDQLAIGLDGTDKSRVVIAYEPIWSSGPARPRPTSPTSRRSPASSRSAPAAWTWCTAAASRRTTPPCWPPSRTSTAASSP